MKRNLRKLHRWLGLLLSLCILMSAGSGVLHNLMSRTQPPPPPAKPGGGALALNQIKIPLSEAEKRFRASLQPPLNEADVIAVNVRTIAGVPWYQVFLQSAPIPTYVNTTTGEIDASADEVYAHQIATDFLGGMSVTKTDYLSSFNKEYINIFRILPVYRFDVADGKGTRVYVSTVTGSVTRHTDNQKQWEANLFSNLHKWMFIHNKNTRDLLLTTTTGGIFLLAALGIVLFFATRPK